MTNPKKINMSSVQVIKTLQLLMQGSYTMQELVEKLNENEKGHVFNNSVVSKYINTCRYCGIEIHKIQNKYIVASIPFGLEITEEEVELLQEIQKIVKSEMTNKSYNVFEGLIEKLYKYSNKKIVTVSENEFKQSFELFEQAINIKRKVKLLFKNKKELECIPVRIVETNEKTYFEVFNKRIRGIDIKRLSGVQMLNEKFVYFNHGEQTSTYTIKGALAARYELRENESLIKIHPDGSKTISIRGEYPESLISRLLRYDDKCELNTPKTYREEIKQTIEETLKNYGE